MEVIITSRQAIKGKDGREWVKFGGISHSGETFDAFASKEVAESWEIPTTAIASPEQVKELFATLPVAEVSYNQRGRVESIKA
jgi:hypothetical protein